MKIPGFNTSRDESSAVGRSSPTRSGRPRAGDGCVMQAPRPGPLPPGLHLISASAHAFTHPANASLSGPASLAPQGTSVARRALLGDPRLAAARREHAFPLEQQDENLSPEEQVAHILAHDLGVAAPPGK